MSDMISIQRPDGKILPAYSAAPSSANPAGAVVVVQEWWGINPQIKGIADRLATAGFRTLVPDLYRGQLATNASAAQQLMSELDWLQAVTQDVQGCVSTLKQAGSTVAVLGFCMGGAITLAAAARLTQMDAAVCFYGIPPAELADLRQIRIPVQAHFAIEDDWCNPTAVAAVERTFQAGSVPYELYRYEAQHAFFNEQRPEVYNPVAAETAWQRSLAFLNTHLRGS
jgi:carboxymethylenebutenolidase